MKPFKEVIDGIRKAVMASEVREDIAQMGEYVEQFANTAGENIQKAIDPTLSVSGKAADAAKVGEAVGQVKEENANEIFYNSKMNANLVVTIKDRAHYNVQNLLNAKLLKPGIYLDNNGNIKESADTYLTNYIDISSFKKLYAQNCSLSAFYDKNLTYISSFTPNDEGTDIPLNAVFARVTIFKPNENFAGLFGDYLYPSLASEVYAEDLAEPTFIVDKSGINLGNHFRSLTECVTKTYGTKCTIIVKAGTYDLYQEFSAKYGDNFTNGTTIYEGLKIQGQKIYCDSGANIVFNYTGDVFNITDYFAPFKFDGEGGELHGGHIAANNCRYAIHDDVFDTSKRSKTVIDGVVIDLNTTRNIAIGGGLGQSSDVTVMNCIFRQLDSNHGDCRAVYYHNAQKGENAISNIKITGNYCNYGSIFIHSFGASTKKSTAIVSNNRCSTVTLFKQDGVIDNIELYQFNNKIETD